MKSGDTFMIEDEDGLKEHLQVVISDPDTNEEFVTVSICTHLPRMEALVTLKVGDHPFIKHASVATFRHARIRQLHVVSKALQTGQARERECVSNDLLDRIRKGLIESDFTRNDVRSYFQSLGL